MTSNLVSRVKFLIGFPVACGRDLEAREQARSWWSRATDERQSRQLETRLFFDPAFLASVQQVQAWSRVRSLAFRAAMMVGLALLATGYTGTATAEDGDGATTKEEGGEQRSTGSWLDWFFGTDEEEGGTPDPEIGTERN
jgi:hypothetical protein